MAILRLLGVFSCAALAACESADSLAPDFGNAVRQNMAAQVIAPDPATLTTPVISSGRRAADAVGRYEEGKVKPPRRPATSQVGIVAGREGQ